MRPHLAPSCPRGPSPRASTARARAPDSPTPCALSGACRRRSATCSARVVGDLPCLAFVAARTALDHRPLQLVARGHRVRVRHILHDHVVEAVVELPPSRSYSRGCGVAPARTLGYLSSSRAASYWSAQRRRDTPLSLDVRKKVPTRLYASVRVCSGLWRHLMFSLHPRLEPLLRACALTHNNVRRRTLLCVSGLTRPVGVL
jgi:hypothetical protein